MNLQSAIDAAIQLAKAGAVVFPGLGAGAELAEKAIDIVEGLRNAPETPTGSKEELEAAHRELYEAMTAKGHALSNRLRG